MMNKGRIKMNKIISICLLVFLVLASKVEAFDNNDFQLWTTEKISWKALDGVIVSVEEEFKWAESGSDFYYEHTDLGITSTGLCDWLTMGINYRLIFEEKGSEWKYENRPHAHVTVKQKYKELKMELTPLLMLIPL